MGQHPYVTALFTALRMKNQSCRPILNLISPLLQQIDTHKCTLHHFYTQRSPFKPCAGGWGLLFSFGSHKTPYAPLCVCNSHPLRPKFSSQPSQLCLVTKQLSLQISIPQTLKVILPRTSPILHSSSLDSLSQQKTLPPDYPSSPSTTSLP